MVFLSNLSSIPLFLAGGIFIVTLIYVLNKVSFLFLRIILLGVFLAIIAAILYFSVNIN